MYPPLLIHTKHVKLHVLMVLTAVTLYTMLAIIIPFYYL